METRLEKRVQKTIETTALGSLVFGFEWARSLGFAAQSLSLSLWEQLYTGRSRRFESPEGAKRFREAFADLTRLLKDDANNIRAGLYPWTVLKPRPLRENLFLYPRVILDGLSITRRRDQKKSKDFDAETEEAWHDTPEYYRRNFHFQTGGYFTEHSADLYDYQVEMLFSGAADAMRRLLLPQLREKFGKGLGEGLHFLEIACGTGRLSRFVSLVYPKARITLLDLSDAYLKKSRAELSDLRKVNFLQGDAAATGLASEHFDAVYSSFLFHELPRAERQKVLQEGVRLLKPGGFYGMVDSLQMGDRPQMDWALEQFPVDFHEPFFKNYVETPLEKDFAAAGLKLVGQRTGFFSKSLAAEKPLLEQKKTKKTGI